MRVAILVPDNRDELGRYDDPHPFFGQALTALLDGLVEESDCEVHLVCCTHRPLAAPARIAPNLFYHAVLVRDWGWLRAGYAGCVWAIRRKLRDIRPDIVHGQGTERYCALAAALSGFPNVVTIHGNMRSVARKQRPRPFSYGWLAARLEAFALPRTLGVFCNSAYTEGEVRPLAQRVWRVPNALRKEFFATPLPPPAPVQRPVLLNIGTVLPYKHQVEVLAVARQLHERGCCFEMQFLGELSDTPYANEFRARLAEAEKQGFARYAGLKGTGDLIRCLDGAAAMVHCASEEAFGLVVAEALARNLKFFGARTGGVVDIASGVEGAELFDPGDWRALESALEIWLRAGGARPAGAAATIRSRYHPQVVGRRHCEIYAELLSTRS